MKKRSSGLLMFRRRGDGIEVLLVHPGGPFWKNKDAHAWSIPKGEFGEDEDPLQAAIREFQEETGIAPAGEFIPLSPVKQSGGKLVHAWAFEGDLDPATIHSNSFLMEWPPHSGIQRAFPEVDRAEWFDIGTAREKIHKGQVPLLRELEELIGHGFPPKNAD